MGAHVSEMRLCSSTRKRNKDTFPLQTQRNQCTLIQIYEYGHVHLALVFHASSPKPSDFNLDYTYLIKRISQRQTHPNPNIVFKLHITIALLV